MLKSAPLWKSSDKRIRTGKLVSGLWVPTGHYWTFAEKREKIAYSNGLISVISCHFSKLPNQS